MSIQSDTAPDLTFNRAVNTAVLSLNKLLASLPSEDYERIAPHLKRVPMRPRELIYKQDAPIDNVYFPGGGACALVKSTEDGDAAEVAVIGAEGAIGAAVFFGLNHSPCDVMVQIPGPYADVMPAAVFAWEAERRTALYNQMIRCSQAVLLQVTQGIACNGLHSAEKRCVRWLLAAHDRAGQDEFALTQEHLATVLGLRRPTVTLIAGALQAAGLIKYRRGRVAIVNRAGLEAASCECYRTVKGAFGRLVPEISSPDSVLRVQ